MRLLAAVACVVWLGLTASGVCGEPSAGKEAELIRIVVPDGIKGKTYRFESCFIVPEDKGDKRKYVPEIGVFGQYKEKRCLLRLGIFADEAQAKSACKAYFAAVALVPEPIILEPGKPAVVIGDEAWQLDNSGVVFRIGRVVWVVYVEKADAKDRVDLGKLLAAGVKVLSAPQVVLTGENAPGVSVSGNNGPSLDVGRIKVIDGLVGDKQEPVVWLANLKVNGAEKADLVGLEVTGGCLIWGDTVLAAKGKTQVWGKGAEMRFLVNPAGTFQIKPGMSVGNEAKWGASADVVFDPKTPQKSPAN